MQPLPDRLTHLSFPEQLTLWSVRLWAEGCRKGQSVHILLNDAYRLAKCEEAYLHLENFLTLMVSANCRAIDVRCLHCDGISADEWRILQSIALAQHQNAYAPAPLLSYFLEPTATRVSLPIIKQWADTLKATKLFLPLREEALAIARQNYNPDQDNISHFDMPQQNKELLH
ncbi:MAG: hypothetical protein MI743_08050 [Sneathiellales bacterium]|nr:hypothetical protein [Sneathiellales bacterium]